MKTITPAEYRKITDKPKRNKYRAIKTELAGRVFDSKSEAARAHVLQDMERSGLITSLSYQPAFQISVNGIKICKYIADFSYWENGQEIAEDSKSIATATNRVFRLKIKLARALYPGVTFRLTGKGVA